jgi:hypothetical protein
VKGPIESGICNFNSLLCARPLASRRFVSSSAARAAVEGVSAAVEKTEFAAKVSGKTKINITEFKVEFGELRARIGRVDVGLKNKFGPSHLFGFPLLEPPPRESTPPATQSIFLETVMPRIVNDRIWRAWRCAAAIELTGAGSPTRTIRYSV